MGPHRTETRPLRDDAEVIEATLGARPQVVMIDAPLSLPRGRTSLDVPGPPHFRGCDLELRRLGIPFFPISLGPMRMLTKRGIRIRSALEEHGVPVFESYPGGTQDILGIPRKGAGVAALRRALRRRGFRGAVERSDITHDELDAIACAWVGRMYLESDVLLLGDPTEGLIALPPLSRASRPFLTRLRAREQKALSAA